MATDDHLPRNAAPHRDGGALAPAPDGRDESANERYDRNWIEILQELRVVQTGTQILAGFLLALAFQPAFAELDELQRGVYLALVVLAGTATVLGLAPVSLHRAVFRRGAKGRLVAFAHRVLRAVLVVASLLVVGVVFLVFDVVLDRVAAFTAAGSLAALVLALWVVVPVLLHPERDSA